MKAEIHITVRDDGKIQVQGSLENPIIAFGLLEIARQQIHEHHKGKQDGSGDSKIIAPPAGLKIERVN